MDLVRDKDGFLNVRLSAYERDNFLNGKKIIKLSGDCKGYFKVSLKLTRIKDPYSNRTKE